MTEGAAKSQSPQNYGLFIEKFLYAWREITEEDDIFIINDLYTVGESISHLDD